MTNEDDPLLDAISETLPRLLSAMEALRFITRHLHPGSLADVVGAVGPAEEPLRTSLTDFKAIDWPENMSEFAARVRDAADNILSAYESLRAAASDPNGIMKAYRALNANTKATEALYPLARLFDPVSRFYLSGEARTDNALIEKLKAADVTRDNVGVLHANNDSKERGGFSLYVPEYYEDTRKWPVIMALHGGSGHGRGFLWSWVREARALGAILISPTSVGETWSLMGPDQDSDNLKRILGFVGSEWSIDPSHILLTGMSDGGTFSYVTGLLEDAPYTHLAPFSASFHPMLLEFVEASRIQDLPIYLTHGALDWMFPVAIARGARDALSAAGANLVYREIDDLSHTYCPEENERIMSWFLQ